MRTTFTLAIFLSAALLFLVQPLAGKILLPLLGGSPAVWNTCMVMFQVLLLLGYLYAHVLTSLAKRGVSVSRQVLIHALVLVGAGLTLPAPIDVGSPAGHDPRVWVMLTLLLGVGPAFFVLSTTSPLLQRWFSTTNDPRARDPYFLYAASNAGSMLGLLCYPLLLEPLLTRQQQSMALTAGFWVLAVLVVGAGVAGVRRGAREEAPARERASGQAPPADEQPVTWKRRAWWLLLAAVPSSLMLGVTQHVSTDIAAVPLLWIVPLSLYLLTFILSFADKGGGSPSLWGRLLPFGVLIVGLTLLSEATTPKALLVLAHLATFFVASMMCHRLLSLARPGASRLTEFFLLVSLGGVLGGAFNALLAPVIFETVLEYAVALAVAVALRPQLAAEWRERSVRSRVVQVVVAGAVALLVFAHVMVFDAAAARGVLQRTGWFHWLANQLPGERPQATLQVAIIAGVPVLLAAFLLVKRGSIRFAGVIGAALLASHLLDQSLMLHRERTFFGVHMVTRSPDVRGGSRVVHQLSHGTTLHGMQLMESPESRRIPSTYYHRSGPLGEVFAAMGERGAPRTSAMIGLGVGTAAAYAEAGRTMIFYEIDPAVYDIARSPALFTFVDDAVREERGQIGFAIGDGRLGIAAADQAAGAPYDLIVVDAFTSDAIPVHLITLEGVRVYAEQLSQDGIIAFHISNRYFDLSGVLARVAQELGLQMRVRNDSTVTDEHRLEGKQESTWVILYRSDAALGRLARDVRWQSRPVRPSDPLWTDDFSNILSVFRGW